jgi:anaerobic ribonucleoside-triphosphate reductase activating protein
MRIGGLRWRTEVEGPGVRTAIWTQGCTINCPHCCNQELIPANGGEEWDPHKLAIMVAHTDTEGITILGGEPLNQAFAVREFLREYRKYASKEKTIWLFSGFPWEKIQSTKLYSDTVTLCDVLIAGPYLQDQTPDPRKWIGSRNQTIHFFSPRETLRSSTWPTHQYDIEVTISAESVTINGWPVI